MASESSDDAAVSVALPPDLDEWLDARAAALDVDRETVVVQLLTAYRAAGEFDDSAMVDLLGEEFDARVDAAIADRVPDVAAAVSEQGDTGGDGDAERVEAAEDRLATEIDGLEREFREKLQDVRERVVQVKRETDAKAPADHGHPAFDDLDALAATVADLEDALDEIGSTMADQRDEQAALAERVDALAGVADRLDDVEERLQTVAWVVSDLRDAVESRRGATSAIDRLKRSAAEADVDRAVCEGCERPVDIALLTEPTCPHCDAAVGDVELPAGFFGKPRLTVARQLAAGDGGASTAGETDDAAGAGDRDGDGDELSNVPDAARRE